MSILVSLYKQSLIADRNNKELALLQNSARRMHMLGTHQGRMDYGEINTEENAIDMQNISDSTELMAINAELDALNNSSSLNYFA